MAEGDRIFTEGGEYLCTLSMTRKAKALLDNEGWKEGEESWLEFRVRTERSRLSEHMKRVKLAKDVVDAYNRSLEGERCRVRRT